MREFSHFIFPREAVKVGREAGVDVTNSIIAPVYTDLTITPDAEALGTKFRSLFQNTSGLPGNQV